jgi:hypothetical protein
MNAVFADNSSHNDGRHAAPFALSDKVVNLIAWFPGEASTNQNIRRKKNLFLGKNFR